MTRSVVIVATCGGAGWCEGTQNRSNVVSEFLCAVPLFSIGNLIEGAGQVVLGWVQQHVDMTLLAIRWCML